MQSLDTHRKALTSLRREHNKHLEREKALGDILDALRTGYNPNYQDMAVLEAVRGWEELAGLPHINDVGKDEAAKTEVKLEGNSPEESMEPGMWSASQLESGLSDLLETDHVSLLLEHEEHMQAPQEGSVREYLSTFLHSAWLNVPIAVFAITSYLPDSVTLQYETFKDSLVSLLQKFGVVSGGDVSAGELLAA